MSRRIEIELTSARPDGSWTWRAAGAREPRGILDGALLPAGAKAGDVVKADADFEIEGIAIVSVQAPKENTRPEPQRIEIIGSGGPDTPGVTTQLVGRSDRRPGDRRPDRDDARPRRDRDGPRSPTGRDSSRPRREGPAAAREKPAPGQEGPPTGDNRPARRPARANPPERRDRGARAPGSSGRPEAAAGSARSRDEHPGRRGERPVRRTTEGGQATDNGTESRPRRFSPGHAHRQAVMASLPPEELPIAEQVLRGGIPAVRTALHLEREKAVAAGRTAPNTDQLIAMAEALLPRLKAAEWRDRAEAAAKDIEEVSLRDLRSVVAGADTARDDETRTLAAGLREALDRRVDAQRARWSEEVANHLAENRVVRALRLAARPPEPAARLDPKLSEQLGEAASQAMAPDTPAERWLALLDAVAASPVRRSVKPVGLPSDPSPELRRATHQQSGRIPALAAMLGITIPPPPVPVAPRRPTRAAKTAPARSGQRRHPDSSDSSVTDHRPAPAPDDQMADPGETNETLALTPAPPVPDDQTADPGETNETPALTPAPDDQMADPGETNETLALTPAPPVPDDQTADPGETNETPALTPAPDDQTADDGPSAEHGQDPVIVEELGEAVRES